MSFITTSDVVSAFISKRHGWSVANQFIATFENNDSFERQNGNALEYIHETINDLIKSGCLTNNVNVELNYYLEELKNYMHENRHPFKPIA